jgi:hypothetical protein
MTLGLLFVAAVTSFWAALHKSQLNRNTEDSYPAMMKATIDIPDTLYRKVKAKSALLGKPVREVTVELYQHWLGEDDEPQPDASLQTWLHTWLAKADEAMRAAPRGPSAREVLIADRSRQDHRRTPK